MRVGSPWWNRSRGWRSRVLAGLPRSSLASGAHRSTTPNRGGMVWSASMRGGRPWPLLVAEAASHSKDRDGVNLEPVEVRCGDRGGHQGYCRVCARKDLQAGLQAPDSDDCATKHVLKN